MPLPPDIDGFAVAERIGTGRRSAVWAAVRTADGLAVALKTTPLAAIADATEQLRLAERLAAITHPHVLRCHGVGRHGDQLWLALERAAGSLADEAAVGPLPPERALAAGRDAAVGLTELHRLGLVHGRIRPSSLLRLADGRLAVAEPAADAADGTSDDLRDLGEALRLVAVPSPGIDAICAAARAGRYRSAADLGEDCAAVLAGGQPGHAITEPVHRAEHGRPASPDRPAGPAWGVAAIAAAAVLLGTWWLAERLLEARPEPMAPLATAVQAAALQVEAPERTPRPARTGPPAPPPPAAAPSVPSRPPADLASWTIAWDAAGSATEPPAGAAAMQVHPLPLQHPDGIGWSRCTPGELLVWDDRHVHHSADGGAAWRQAFSQPSSGSGRTAERSAAWAGERVLLAAGDLATFGLLSRDRGRSFAAIALPPGLADGFPAVHGRTMLADGSLVLAARLADGGDTLLASHDDGATWTAAGTYATDRFGDALPLGPVAGLLRTEGFGRWAGSADRGASWSGLGESAWVDVATWEHGGAQHLLLGRALVRWTRLGVARAQLDDQPVAGPRGVAIDPRDPLHLLVGGTGGLMRSADGGRSWSRLRRGLPDGVQAMDLVGRERPRLAVATQRNLIVLDLAHPGFADLFAPDGGPAGAARLDPPGNATPGLDLAVAGAPGLVVAWHANQAWTGDVTGAWRSHRAAPHVLSGPGNDPSRDADGRWVLLPDEESAWLLDRRDGAATRLPTPWGATLPSRYAVPPIMRADGSIVAAWMRDGAGAREARRCVSRDLGRSWNDEAVIPARRWLVADAATPLLLYAAADGLRLSLDLGASELPESVPAEQHGVVWGCSGGRLWAIDSGWRQLCEFDPATRSLHRHPVARPPADLVEDIAIAALAVDPADPRRLWLRARPAGLIHSSDAGRSWRPVRAGIVAGEAGRLVFVAEAAPWLLLGGTGCAWRLDAGPDGAGLFADWGAPIP